MLLSRRELLTVAASASAVLSGAAAVGTIGSVLAALSGGPSVQQQVLLPTELVVRRTTAPPAP